ncbi:MAG: pilin [bacterium]
MLIAVIPPDDSSYDPGSSDSTEQQQNDTTGLNQWQKNLQNARIPSGYQETQSPETIIGKIIKIVLDVLGVIFLCLMVYGGYLWMTASGNEEKISKAKSIITNSTIGLIIVLAAYAVTYFVIEQLTQATNYVG